MDATVPRITAVAGSSLPLTRRADAGTVRLGGRDAAGLLLCGDMYGVPYVLAVRLSLQDSDAFRDGGAWWRSERRIRATVGGRVGTAHVPDAEVSWPEVPGSAYAGELWAIEAELTPKPLARTAAPSTPVLRGTPACCMTLPRRDV
jgi:hypothetical protein